MPHKAAPNVSLSELHAARMKRHRQVERGEAVSACVAYAAEIAPGADGPPAQDRRDVTVRDGRGEAHGLDSSGFELASGMVEMETEAGQGVGAPACQ